MLMFCHFLIRFNFLLTKNNLILFNIVIYWLDILDTLVFKLYNSFDVVYFQKAVMDRRLFDDEAFVRAQYVFVQEGQLRKQKCIYCAAYFKDSMFTLQTHIRDKCSSRPAVIKRTVSDYSY